MANIININKQPLSVKEYQGNMVVTFKDIDTVHGRPNGTARKRFNDNKQHFVEGEDFFKVCSSEIRTNKIKGISDKCHRDVIFVTESGYLMLAKSFTDDLAWKVQRELVNRYFKSKVEVKPYEYFDKTYNGVPVLSTADISYFTGMNIATANYYLRTKAKRNVDYYYLEGETLKSYKFENPRASKLSSSLCLVTKSGFIKLCKEYCVKIETPKCFEQPKQLELQPICKSEEILKTLSLQQVDELFDKEAICIGDKNGVPVYRVAEIFGREAVDFSRRLSDPQNKYGSKIEKSFRSYGIGETYSLDYVTKKAFRIAATYHNIDVIRSAGL